ncbi:MAG: SGNH/GDSL hydrolase family protein [Mycobacteriaceae bacterium]
MVSLTATPVTPDLVRGTPDVEHTERGVLPCRLPAWARAQADPQLQSAQAQPSGVRLVFRTAATVVDLTVHRTSMQFRGVAPRPPGRYDLLIDNDLVAQVEGTGGTLMTIDPAAGTMEVTDDETGVVHFSGLPEGEKTVEIWLPHYERIELDTLHTDAPIEPVPDRNESLQRWLHHGSSISQGSNAASPSTTWVALTARQAGVEPTNLGFSGSAMLDQFVARTMRDLPADVLSVEIGINLVNSDAMRVRTFTAAVHGFLDTLRDGHPHTPLYVITPILCPIHEETPGPLATDFSDGTIQYAATGDPAGVPAGKLTLQVVRRELARIVEQRAADDPHLHLVDGLELYGEQDAAAHPLTDRLHPDSVTHQQMAERFTAQVFGR